MYQNIFINDLDSYFSKNHKCNNQVDVALTNYFEDANTFYSTDRYYIVLDRYQWVVRDFNTCFERIYKSHFDKCWEVLRLLKQII